MKVRKYILYHWSHLLAFVYTTVIYNLYVHKYVQYTTAVLVEVDRHLFAYFQFWIAIFLIRIFIRTRCTALCDKVCQWLATGRWLSPGPPVSSTNKPDRHDIPKILLKVALTTIKQTNKQTKILQLQSRLKSIL
jgi:hypothetical protein